MVFGRHRKQLPPSEGTRHEHMNEIIVHVGLLDSEGFRLVEMEWRAWRGSQFGLRIEHDLKNKMGTVRGINSAQRTGSL